MTIKKINFLLPSFLFTTALCAQVSTNEIKKPGMRADVKEISVINYSAFGDSLEAKKGSISSKPESHYSDKFNTAGRKTEHVVYNFDGVPESRITYAYKNDSLLTSEIFYNAANKPIRKRILTYTENGKLLTEEIRNAKDSLDQKLEIKYAENGFPVLEIIKNGRGDFLKKVETKNDSKGQKLEESWYDTDGKTPVSKMVFKYDDKGNNTGVRIVKPTGGVISSKSFTYDERNNMTGKFEYDAENKLRASTETKYDSKNRIISEIKKKGDGTVQKKSSFVYNTDGWIVEESRFMPEKDREGIMYMKHDQYGNIKEKKMVVAGQPKAVTETFTYEYDKKGNWVKMISSRKGIPNEWIERAIVYEKK